MSSIALYAVISKANESEHSNDFLPLFIFQYEKKNEFSQRILYFFSLFHVTMANEKRFTDSSSKIEIIIQKIIELKRDEPNVKIVIFSQWSNILTFIEMALVSAEISYRSKLEKFHQTIQEFKVKFIFT